MAFACSTWKIKTTKEKPPKGSSSREMDCLSGESVVVVRRRPKKNKGQRWSLAEDVRQVAQPDRQSICLTAGFLTFSPQRTSSVNSSTSLSSQSKSWRHSYACDGDTNTNRAISHQNQLYSIREEENDVAARSATLRTISLTALSS